MRHAEDVAESTKPTAAVFQGRYDIRGTVCAMPARLRYDAHHRQPR